MARVDSLPIAPHIEEAAADWVARRDTAPFDARTEAEFEAWLKASPAHEAAYRRFSNLWADLDSLSSRPAPAPAAANDVGRIGRRALAAGLVLSLVAGGALFGLLRAGRELTFETAVGEQRAVTLADTSRVTMNTDTRFRVDYSARGRQIHLERGEALFEVAHDPSRPFTVVSPAARVRAVGTRFRVRVLDAGRLDVLVTEGRVLVSRQAAAGPAAPASAGQQVRVSDRVAVTPVSADELNRRLAWRQGDIVFSGEPLAQAAEEMQRYTAVRITVDPAVGRYSVGGYFRTNDVEAFLQTVESLFPVRVVRAAGEVRLVARPI